MKILIMAGGSGERFWPLSTKENPKQLLKLITEKSMIRETIDRILNLVQLEDIFIATNEVQVKGIIKELPEFHNENIIIEPSFKDTAAAIAYGSAIISRYNDNPSIVVLASDHLISDIESFVKAIKIAEAEALKGNIVTLGIKPTRPEIGYGYIKVESNTLNMPTKVIKFLEKPKLDIAQKYYISDDHLWNSGMFVFKYDTLINELKLYVPKHLEIINNIIDIVRDENGIVLSNLVKPYFEDFEKISIDYAIMEKSKLIKCIPVDIGWSDVGGYNSLEEIFEKDDFGNVKHNCKYYFIDSENNVVISEDPFRKIISIGVSNTIIVDSKNGVLIANRNDSHKIKIILNSILN